jgi:lipopolysaccharide heptosyltransferase I
MPTYDGHLTQVANIQDARGIPPSAKRILLIRPSALGDVCRTVPVLASLRRAYPTAIIHWLVQDTFVEAVEHHPALNGVIPFPRRTLARWYTPRGLTRVRSFLRGLRSGSYDLVVDAQGLFRSGLFAWATRAPIRVGHAGAAEMGWLFVNHRVASAPDAHTVDRMLDLVRGIGIEAVRDLRLSTSSEAHQRIAQLLEPVGAAARIGILAPTSRWEGKRWPVERFSALAERLLKTGDVERVAVVGAPGEEGQCGPLLSLAERDRRVIPLIGRLGIGDLMALIERSWVVVANDSATLHMSVGLSTRYVGLYGPTDVARVGPAGGTGTVIQHIHPGDRLDHKAAAPGRKIMERITVDEVFDAVERLSAEKADGLLNHQDRTTTESA